jgi:electron transfer flavoprotein alpha/beta subunit
MSTVHVYETDFGTIKLSEPVVLTIECLETHMSFPRWRKKTKAAKKSYRELELAICKLAEVCHDCGHDLKTL